MLNMVMKEYRVDQLVDHQVLALGVEGSNPSSVANKTISRKKRSPIWKIPGL
jgi:hypothetical protein